MNFDEPKKDIVFDYKNLGDDLDLILNNEYQYCMKQCYKMAYYVEKLHNFEILSMNTEFLKDENKTIWFSHASNIRYRYMSSKGEEALKSKRIQYINKDHQAQLLSQLEQHKIE